jgi:glycosyltransferase involved in cell wall biosynthesis
MSTLEARTAVSPSISLRFIDPGATGERRHLAFLHALAVMSGLRLRGKIDLAHLNVASRGSAVRKVALAVVLRLLRTPYVMHLHGAEFDTFFRGLPRILRGLVRSAFKGAAAVIVLGNRWRDFATTELKLPLEAIYIVPNCGPGPKSMPERSGSARVLFSGRMDARKGVFVLLEAIEAMQPEENGWSVSLCGDGEVSVVRELAARLGDSVAVRGWLNGPALDEEYARCDIFALPSRAEGLPLSLLEAMAWGHAIVTTDVGSIGEAVADHESALLVPSDDPGALRRALCLLVREPQLRRRLGRAARSRWEAEYSPEIWEQRLMEVYDVVLMGRHE